MTHPDTFKLTGGELRLLHLLASDIDKRRPWQTPEIHAGVRPSATAVRRGLDSLDAKGMVDRSEGRTPGSRPSSLVWTWTLTPLGLAVYCGALVAGHNPDLPPYSFTVYLP